MKRKKLLFLANRLIEKTPDLCNAKEHYQWFLRKKNRKSVKQSEIITNQPKLENPDIVDIKSVVIKHAKSSHKLFKTIRQSEKVASNSPLYSDTKKCKNFLNEKNVKITKLEHALKGYASTCYVEILNSFNPELQLLQNLQLEMS